MEVKQVNQGEFKVSKLKKSAVSVTMKSGMVELLRDEGQMEFDRPGEYEVGGVGIVGIKTESGVVFVLHAEEMIIAHLDGVKELTEKQTDLIGPIDVLMVRASTEVAKMVKSLSPSIAIPIGENAEIEGFIEKMGVEKNQMDKLALNKGDLPEETSVIVLA